MVFFLVATKRFYMRVCPSVRPSVRRSVGWSVGWSVGNLPCIRPCLLVLWKYKVRSVSPLANRLTTSHEENKHKWIKLRTRRKPFPANGRCFLAFTVSLGRATNCISKKIFSPAASQITSLMRKQQKCFDFSANKWIFDYGIILGKPKEYPLSVCTNPH